MEYESIIQIALDDIDCKITENIKVEELACAVNYSVYHFCRIFVSLTGTPVKNYVVRRKLEHALYDLAQGQRIIDIAMKYGFETHAGFTKAFKKCFGLPPSLYRLHIISKNPKRATIKSVKEKYGGIRMKVKIKKMEPVVVVGYTSRHRITGVNSISDIPAFYSQKNMDYAAELSTLHHTYTKSHHCEISICFDVDEEHDCFTYMLGVGVDEADGTTPQRKGTFKNQIDGGLYAIFTTPRVDKEKYIQSVIDTWEKILSSWLPESIYVYDNSRCKYEYYDERDHSWLNDGKSCMEIRLPICKKLK